VRVLSPSQHHPHPQASRLPPRRHLLAANYIRFLRLQRAARLLVEQPERSVFCISVEVEFNDHSYFTKRFREVHGVCPGEYRERGGDLGHLW
jgi:AraC-like DNA-binding protein